MGEERLNTIRRPDIPDGILILALLGHSTQRRATDSSSSRARALDEAMRTDWKLPTD